MTSYKKLDAWIFSMDLVKEVYQLTKRYPKEEMFGLTSQTKRAAVSIPSNIAEGLGRNFKKDSIQFLHISRGSAYEVETLLSIAMMAGIINSEIYSNINQMIEKAIRLINGLISYLENNPGLK
ncbi:MAG TPA: four helix bundle protein [Puia sp.]|nr:four helix bundle protein [Puia sp.]